MSSCRKGEREEREKIPVNIEVEQPKVRIDCEKFNQKDNVEDDHDHKDEKKGVIKAQEDNKGIEEVVDSQKKIEVIANSGVS